MRRLLASLIMLVFSTAASAAGVPLTGRCQSALTKGKPLNEVVRSARVLAAVVSDELQPEGDPQRVYMLLWASLELNQNGDSVPLSALREAVGAVADDIQVGNDMRWLVRRGLWSSERNLGDGRRREIKVTALGVKTFDRINRETKRRINSSYY